MHRGLARLAVRRRCERNARPNGRHMMTAPLKHSEPITVGVALGERAYEIVIGRDALQSLGARIAALRPGARTAIVTDRNVAKHWLEKTEASLGEAGIASSRIIVDVGEGSKTYAGLEQVSEALISAKIERNDLVVALGGGVIGDLAGFAAAILRRGVDLVQVPTSLLAQVDSSVGGKTGINSPQGKNLLGAFHQPLLVVADTAVLDTLPPRQFRAGYAEIAKYGVLGDEAFFAWLEANHADIFAGGAAREHAIATSCRAKVGLPTHLQDIAGFAQEGLADADALMALMAQDKKVKRGRLTFILLEAVGRAVIAPDVEPSLVRDFLKRKLALKTA